MRPGKLKLHSSNSDEPSDRKIRDDIIDQP